MRVGSSVGAGVGWSEVGAGVYVGRSVGVCVGPDRVDGVGTVDFGGIDKTCLKVSISVIQTRCEKTQNNAMGTY